MGLRTPIQPSSASYTPGVRLMLVCVVIGIIIGWPLLRLSQSMPRFPLRQVILDLIVLLALVQIVLWPLRLVTTWSPARTLAVDATIAGWAALAGAIVASAVTTSRTGPRALAMLACVALCLLGPTLAWVGLMTGKDWFPLVELSPLMAVTALTRDNAPPAAQQWTQILILLTAAAATWLALAAYNLLRPGPTGIRGPEPLG